MKRREFLISAGLAGVIAPQLGRSAVPCPPPTVGVSGGTSASTACGPSKAPEWFTSMPDKTWIAIAGGPGFGTAAQNGTRFSGAVAPIADQLSGNEGGSGMINDWTGGCVFQTGKQYLIPAQGGHAGLYNCVVMSLDLSAAVPEWRCLWFTPLASVNHPNFPTGNDTPAADNNDGSPCGTHGWLGTTQCDVSGRILNLYGGSNANGNSPYTTDSASALLSAFTSQSVRSPWMYHGRYYTAQDLQANLYLQYAAGAYDPIAGVIWLMADQVIGGVNSLFKINIAQMVAGGQQNRTTCPLMPGVTGFALNLPSPSWSGWSSIVYWNGSPYMIICSTVGNRQKILVMKMDATNPASTFTQINTTNPESGLWTKESFGNWHPASNGFLVFDLGGPVYKLSLTMGTNGPLNGTYTWSKVTNNPGTATPFTDQGSQFNGLYSKLRIVNDMGNGQSALVAGSCYNGPTFVYKIPLSGV